MKEHENETEMRAIFLYYLLYNIKAAYAKKFSNYFIANFIEKINWPHMIKLL
jgi:hypothetical protein